MSAKDEKVKGAIYTLVLQTFVASCLLALASYTVALFVVCDPLTTKSVGCSSFDGFWQFFNTNIRASLFAGFLSLGGFLLSLKTFIIVNMKKDVFDTAKYAEKFEAQKKLSRDGVGRRYDPLRELSGVLFAAIATAITTSVLQITLGLVSSFWTAFLCLWAAAFATMLLVLCLWLIKSNLNTMFSHLED